MTDLINKDVTQGTGKDVGVTRAMNALALHLAGATEQQVAKQLGYANAAAARSAWERLLAGTVTQEDKERVRKTEAARLDRLQMAWWNKAIDPKNPEQGSAARMVLSIMERRARMLGLDAPSRVEVYTPTSQEIMTFVQTLRSYAGVTDEQEPDIIEIDSVDATQ